MAEPRLEICVVPANETSWEDLQTIFGTRGAASRCQCQRYKLRPREAFAKFPVEERAHRLRQQTGCGDPESDGTSGLVAYLNGDPVGWCAVEPRTAYAGLVRNARVPWEGREEDKTDSSVWAVTCLFTRAGYRKRVDVVEDGHGDRATVAQSEGNAGHAVGTRVMRSGMDAPGAPLDPDRIAGIRSRGLNKPHEGGWA